MPIDFLRSSDDRVITSWDNFLAVEALVSAELSAATPGLLARGQASHEWALRPSLHRKLPRDFDVAEGLAVERQILDRFKAEVRNLLPELPPSPDDDLFAWWDLLQHYGAPTRLLDWSTSLRVAAYFAACDIHTSDGAIWLLSPWVVFEGARSLINPDAPLEAVCCDPNAPHVVVARNPRRATERMAAQSSQFTVCTNLAVDHGTAISRIFASGRADFVDQIFLRLLLPRELKSQFLAKLGALGVSEVSLFPKTDAPRDVLREIARAATASAFGSG